MHERAQRVPVVSLGAGVQSTTLLLMAAAGEFETVPGLAIFADTQHEPAAVLEHLEWLEREVAGRIEIARVSAGDLLNVATERKFNPIPLYLRNPDGTSAAGRRQCTKEFKLYPIRHELRRRQLDPVEMWVGISLDEVQRMKGSGLRWVENRWPLIERRMTRNDCVAWLKSYGVPHLVPKSACVFCPFKRSRDFAEMRDSDPESFARAVAADEAMRTTADGREQFVLSSLVPLRDVETAEDRGQLTVFDFMDECEGMCGV